VRCVPVASNPHVAFGGVMLERLCTAFGEHGKHTLVSTPASARRCTPRWPRRAGRLRRDAVAAGVVPGRARPADQFVDTHGSTASFLQAAADAAPQADVVLVHAGATDLCRLFARSEARPLLLADDRRPA
jgi:flagellar biosynthesis protein FlhG